MRQTEREKRSEQVLVKHQVAGSHMLNQWFLTPHHLCTIQVINMDFFHFLSTFPRQFARTSPSLRLHTLTCWALTWTRCQCECSWSMRSWTATQHYRPNLYQSIAALSPRCLACSVAPSAEGRACHRAGTGLNSFKVTLWFNGDAFFKTASSLSLLPPRLVHLCHKHWLRVSPLAVEAPGEVV